MPQSVQRKKTIMSCWAPFASWLPRKGQRTSLVLKQIKKQPSHFDRSAIYQKFYLVFELYQYYQYTYLFLMREFTFYTQNHAAKLDYWVVS